MNIIDDDLLAFIQNAHGGESDGFCCGFSETMRSISRKFHSFAADQENYR